MKQVIVRGGVIIALLQLCHHSCPANGLFLTASMHQMTNHSNENASFYPPSSTKTSRVKNTHTSSSSLYATKDTAMDGARMSATRSSVPKVFFALNAATKWMVTVAVTVGVFWDLKSFQGPYIVVGSIAATYVAKKLKKIINQGRPDGAPFMDPGMPSSHALVSFFIAAAWYTALKGNVDGNGMSMTGPCLLGSASFVSLLRVICGYHTIPQIVVGSLLGTVMGKLWCHLGFAFNAQNKRLTFILAWSSYVVGSALYIKKEMTRWFMDEKFL